MKTITLKTQDDFFNQINQMALEEKISKSALIRKAIKAYQKKMKNIEMTRIMQEDSLRSRGLDDELLRDFDCALMDGLEEEPLKGWVSDDVIKQAIDELKLSEK